MVLHLQSNHLRQISSHAEQTYPEECCGLLFGTIDCPTNTHTLVEVHPVANAWDAEAEATMQAVYAQTALGQKSVTKLERYWIDPGEMLKAQRDARDRQLDIIGVYHSHPDHAAIPSECDRALAWTQYAYLIVSVQAGIAQAPRCWVLDEQHCFRSEAIIIL